MDFDTENPALQEYIGQRVQQELEKYKLLENLKHAEDPALQEYIGQRVQQELEKYKLLENLKDTKAYNDSIYCAIDQMSQNQDNNNRTRTSRMQQLLAGLKNTPGEGELDQDVFSMMMMSISLQSWKEWALVWAYGIFAYGLQITLGILVIMDQMESEFGGTAVGIPIRGTPSLFVAKTLAIVLSVLTQTDFLMSFRNILILWKKDSWKKLKYDATQNTNINDNNDNKKNFLWWIYIFIPNVLKGTQGLLILSASFVLIMQSENTVDLLKDYSALFVISEVDNLLFNVADMGYVGSILSGKADTVKDLKFEEEKKEEKHWKWLTSALFSLFAIFIGAWIYVAVGQVNGRYVKQKYPICNFPEQFNNTDVTFLNIIGDAKCQYPKEEGTNVLECGWDGGDCELINERYPECSVIDFTKLGDGKCDDSTYNNRLCGFDNGDCVETNKKMQDIYPKCTVENVGWINDTICNGGEYASDDCDNDGGDCADCIVDNMDLIGDGNCDTWTYNTRECSYDGGDCLELNRQKEEQYKNCSVSNIGWIGDGVCNGVDYMTSECGDDEGDCDACLEEYPTLDEKQLGNGFCDGEEYNTEVCGFDAGDCVQNNTNLQQQYPGCVVLNPIWIGDGRCHAGEYNTEQCGFDGGDCIAFNIEYPGCIVEKPYLVGDGNCSGVEYSTPECKLDGGDCRRVGVCTAENQQYIGDGFCDGGIYNTKECNFDDGDCDDCIVAELTLVGNGVCDGREYNTLQCDYDGGDCFEENDVIQKRYPRCVAENIGWINDGICDGFEYATEECGRDGGDCRNACDKWNEALIGDGFCDEENNGDGCTFDGNDCVPSMKLIGEYADSGKWSEGVLGHDGNMYGIPFNMNKILKIDPSSNATNPTALVGDDLVNGWEKWWGGVVGNDGIIYGVPFNAKSILSFNPTTEETKLIAENHPLLEGWAKVAGGVFAENGMIYFIPYDSNKVVKFDPSNLEDPLTEIGDDLGWGGFKMVGGVLGSDGNIYAIPYSGTRVLKINIGDDTTSFLGDEYPDSRKWMNGVLAKDGNIYACPYMTNQILQIDVQSQTTNLVGPDLGGHWYKWSGFVEGEDGFLYGIPLRSSNLLRFDPIHQTATFIPLPQETLWEDKWQRGVRAENGFIYGIPHDADQVLSIAPLKFRP